MQDFGNFYWFIFYVYVINIIWTYCFESQTSLNLLKIITTNGGS